MRYIVTYQRTSIQLPNGRRSTDSFQVRDTASSPVITESEHVTRSAALARAATLNHE